MKKITIHIHVNAWKENRAERRERINATRQRASVIPNKRRPSRAAAKRETAKIIRETW